MSVQEAYERLKARGAIEIFAVLRKCKDPGAATRELSQYAPDENDRDLAEALKWLMYDLKDQVTEEIIKFSGTGRN